MGEGQEEEGGKGGGEEQPTISSPSPLALQVFLSLSGDSGVTQEVVVSSDPEDLKRGATHTFTFSGADVGENRKAIVRLVSGQARGCREEWACSSQFEARQLLHPCLGQYLSGWESSSFILTHTHVRASLFPLFLSLVRAQAEPAAGGPLHSGWKLESLEVLNRKSGIKVRPTWDEAQPEGSQL
jgi:hypothetical protein